MKRILYLFVCLTLAACGGGGGSSSPTPPPVMGPAPAPPPTSSAPDLTQAKLLNDQEMETQPLSPIPSVNDAYADWIRENHFPIRSITYDQDFSDLAFLEDLIGDRTIVQLGESSHGTREFNYVKTRLIKYLHQNMDFKVLAFESGFFESVYVDNQRETASADTLMQFLFGPWQTNEVYELFQYVRETQTTSNPLRITGFDVQISSGYYGRVGDYIDNLPTTGIFTSSLKNKLRTELLEYRDIQISRAQSGCFNPPRNSVCDDLMDDMEAIKTQLSEISDELDKIENPTREIKVLSISIFAASAQIDGSRAGYLGQDSNSIRDKNMAATFDKLKEDIFPDEKIIIWAHNRHVAHETDLQDQDPFLINTPMGSFLKQTYSDDLFSIGLYMLRGETADNNRMAVPVVQLPNNGLEAILHAPRQAALFIDTGPDQTRVDGNAFLFEPLEAFYWGGSYGTYNMVPSEQFDGILVIDQSSIPSYR